MKKDLIDAYSDVEIELGRQVYEYYKYYRIIRNDAHMYNVKIKELSKSSKYSEKYLRALKNVYRDSYATKQDLIDEQCFNVEMSKNLPEYIIFGDKLFELPEARRNNYVLSSKITMSNLNGMLMKYKRHNGKYSCMVDDFLSQYSVFYKEYYEEEKRKNMLIDYKKCLAIFSEIVNLGFYSISHYSEFLYEPGYNYTNSVSYLNSIKRKIMEYDRVYGKKNWDIILKGFEKNRKKSYLILKDRIDRFNSMMSERVNDSKFNIIDYYLIVGISFKNYKDICSGYISRLDMNNFNSFINKYQKSPYDNSYFERIDKKISDDVKAMLYGFLRENSIPECYYNYVVEKYLDGELDSYINVNQKTI